MLKWHERANQQNTVVAQVNTTDTRPHFEVFTITLTIVCAVLLFYAAYKIAEQYRRQPAADVNAIVKA